MYKIVKFIIIGFAFCLNACANLQNIDQSNLNQLQQIAIQQEMTGILTQNFNVKSYPNIGLNVNTPLAKNFEDSLKKMGYAVDKPNSKNITLRYTLNRLDDKTLFFNLNIGQNKLSRLYYIRPDGLIAISPLSFGNQMAGGVQ